LSVFSFRVLSDYRWALGFLCGDKRVPSPGSVPRQFLGFGRAWQTSVLRRGLVGLCSDPPILIAPSCKSRRASSGRPGLVIADTGASFSSSSGGSLTTICCGYLSANQPCSGPRRGTFG